MWIIVHFVNENTIEVVPDTWIKKNEKSCAWPINKNSSRKLIEKRSYPNDAEYKWFPSRTVGKFKSYIEATKKADEIMSKTDISSRDDEGKKVSTSKKMRSPPKLLIKENADLNVDERHYSLSNNSPIKKKIGLKDNNDGNFTYLQSTSRSINKNKQLKFSSSAKRTLFETNGTDEIINQENEELADKSHYFILNSPIGKINVKDNDQDFTHLQSTSRSINKNKQLKFSSSAKRTLFETNGTDEIINQENEELADKRYYSILHSPIGKIVVEDNDQYLTHLQSTSRSINKNKQLKFSSSAKRTLFETNGSDKSFYQGNKELVDKRNYSILNSPIGKIVVEDNDQDLPHLQSTSQSNDKNKTPLFSSSKTLTDKFMPNCDFQTFVINTLIKMKYDISGINSKTNATHILLNSFLTNSAGSVIRGQLNNQIVQTSDYYDSFPIKTEEDLQTAEDKILDKNVRSNLVLKLALLVGVKDVGDSVRRLMTKMFSDEVLTSYSLLGFKKKKNFSKLQCYNLLIDALRVHSKFKNIISKEIDKPLATWIAHAPFRLKSNNTN